MVRRTLLMGLAFWLSACASVPPPRDMPVLTVEPAGAWARVLARFVDEQGRVDFDGLARDSADLDRYVAWIYQVSPQSQPDLFPTRAQVLAYHLNAYNALAMYKVIRSGNPASLAGLKKVGFFYLGPVRVGGQEISLYDYENKVIRAFGEPRVHFALNCMSIGCPRLPREPFSAAQLEAQLEHETRSFFSESRNARADAATRTVYLSEILDFYTGDFLAVAPSLTAYVNRYRESPLPLDYAVQFTPYDWTINRQP